MALRNRNTARPRDDAPGLRDVALGPTIYGGERYSKMSERLKRQHRKPGDVAASSTRLLAPQLIGFGLALVVVLSLVFWMMYQAAQRRRSRFD